MEDRKEKGRKVKGGKLPFPQFTFLVTPLSTSVSETTDRRTRSVTWSQRCLGHPPAGRSAQVRSDE